MARGNAHTFDAAVERHRQPSLAREARLLLSSLRRRWRAFEHAFIFQNRPKPAFTTVYLGTYSGDCKVDEAYDGDLVIESISGNCEITLESRHGSITVARSIEQGSQANLKAAKTVAIGQGVRHCSTVQINSGGDVTIGGTVADDSHATITSAGKIDIGSTLENRSTAKLTAATVRIGQSLNEDSTALITAQGDILIEGGIKHRSSADIISLQGSIRVGKEINGQARALLTAGKNVNIDGQISDSEVTIRAQDDVAIAKTVGENSSVNITSVTGSINVGQDLNSGARATLIATNGSINIGGSVEAGSTINWNARDFNCPHQEGSVNQSDRAA